MPRLRGNPLGHPQKKGNFIKVLFVAKENITLTAFNESMINLCKPTQKFASILDPHHGKPLGQTHEPHFGAR